MITYQPFWETLKSSGKSTYSLIHDHSISSATINRLRQDQPVSTSTINDLCIILNCAPGDILAFTPPAPEQKPYDVSAKRRPMSPAKEIHSHSSTMRE